MAAIGILIGPIGVAIGIVVRLVGIGARLLGGSIRLFAYFLPAALIVLGIIWLLKGASRGNCQP